MPLKSAAVRSRSAIRWIRNRLENPAERPVRRGGKPCTGGKKPTAGECRFPGDHEGAETGYHVIAGEPGLTQKEEQTMPRTIRVTGKGTIHVKPDMTRLTIDLKGLEKEYDAVMRRSAEETRSLRDVLADLGFKAEDMKTLSFDVNTKYENYRDERDDWKSRFVGYEYEHRMKLEFPSDNALLGRVLYALAHAPVNPEFAISAFVRDPEPVRNELLGKAVADAVAKSGVLAKAANVTLGSILSIDYAWTRVDFEVNVMDRCEEPMACDCAADRYDVDIEPDDVDASDTVTVVWEIK